MRDYFLIIYWTRVSSKLEVINCADSYLFVNDSCSKAKARSQKERNSKKEIVMKLNETDETGVGRGT